VIHCPSRTSHVAGNGLSSPPLPASFLSCVMDGFLVGFAFLTPAIAFPRVYLVYSDLSAALEKFSPQALMARCHFQTWLNLGFPSSTSWPLQTRSHTTFGLEVRPTLLWGHFHSSTPLRWFARDLLFYSFPAALNPSALRLVPSLAPPRSGFLSSHHPLLENAPLDIGLSVYRTPFFGPFLQTLAYFVL